MQCKLSQFIDKPEHEHLVKAAPDQDILMKSNCNLCISACPDRESVERARELFEHTVQMAPADAVNPLYLQFAKLEEDYGLAKRAMEVYDQATKAVPNHEKLGMYEIYIACAAEIFGVPKTREIYEQGIESGLPDKDTKTMCSKYAELERSLGEIDRARGIYVFASQFADPCPDAHFWDEWRRFEVQHGNEDTFTQCFCKL